MWYNAGMLAVPASLFLGKNGRSKAQVSRYAHLQEACRAADQRQFMYKSAQPV